MPLTPTNRIQPLATVAPPLFVQRSEVGASAAPSNGSGLRDAAPEPLQLSPLQFALVWVVYVAVATLSATLAVAFAAIYYGASTIRVGYMIETMGLLSLEYIPFVIVCYAVLGVFFWKLSLQAIVGSIRGRSLVFKLPALRGNQSKGPISVLGLLSEFVTKHVPFEVTFLIREIAEVVTQTYQVYKCNSLISEAWINNFYTSFGVEHVAAAMTSRVDSGPTNLPVNHQMKQHSCMWPVVGQRPKYYRR